jgi:hypothetical protein
MGKTVSFLRHEAYSHIVDVDVAVGTARRTASPAASTVQEKNRRQMQTQAQTQTQTQTQTPVVPKRSSSLTLTTVTLQSILDHLRAPAVMDYLSLDVEGWEQAALEGWDHQKHIFLIITVERPSESVHRLLTQRQYWFMTQLPLGKVSQVGTFGECVYIHESHPNFKEKMNVYRSQARRWDVIPSWWGAAESGSAGAGVGGRGTRPRVEPAPALFFPRWPPS